MQSMADPLWTAAPCARAAPRAAPAADTRPHLHMTSQTFAPHGANAEVEASKVALEKSASADVKAFAQQMVDDHGKAGSELKGLADQKGVKVDDGPSTVKKAEIKVLSGRKGASFDQHYADSIGVKAHEDTVKLFQKEVDKGTDPDVKAWAQKTLPALQHHLEMARQLKAKTDAEPKS